MGAGEDDIESLTVADADSAATQVRIARFILASESIGFTALRIEHLTGHRQSAPSLTSSQDRDTGICADRSLLVVASHN